MRAEQNTPVHLVVLLNPTSKIVPRRFLFQKSDSLGLLVAPEYFTPLP